MPCGTDTGTEESRTYHATSFAEALTMAERDDAGQATVPHMYALLPRDHAAARAEGLEINDADGMVLTGTAYETDGRTKG